MSNPRQQDRGARRRAGSPGKRGHREHMPHISHGHLLCEEKGVETWGTVWPACLAILVLMEAKNSDITKVLGVHFNLVELPSRSTDATP